MSAAMTPGRDPETGEALAAEIIVDAVAELMAHASHDLVGPLNRAASLLDILIRRYRNHLDAEADRVLEFLVAASARMEQVAAGIEQYIELARNRDDLTTVDLNESLGAALDRLERAIRESGAVVQADHLPTVSGNSAQMTTVFELLIGNSIKFRSPNLKPHIRVSSSRIANLYDIEVTDNGIGIDPQYAEVVFEPFRRLNGAQYAGPGLGLTLAKLIASLHHGSMRIEPSQESGVRVHLTLPAGNRQ